jgi:hypothetical protein
MNGRFFEPMLCLAVPRLPESPEWQLEVKLDGYRGMRIKSHSRVDFDHPDGGSSCSGEKAIAAANRWRAVDICKPRYSRCGDLRFAKKRLLSKVRKGITHRVARNVNQSFERVIQLQDKEDRGRD